MTTPDPAFGPLLAAAQTRRAVEFEYRKPSESGASTRRLEPWGLRSEKGRWYVAGRDLDRGEPRVFRLSRIEGQVRPVGAEAAFEVPPESFTWTVSTWGPQQPLQAATVAVAPERAASLRRQATGSVAGADGFDELTLGFRDEERFADQLVSYGASVRVLAPPALRAAVVRRLRAALTAAEAS